MEYLKSVKLLVIMADKDYLACHFFVYRRFPMQNEFIKKNYLLKLLDGKWRIPIIEELFAGTKSFNDLKSDVKGISAKVLNDNLVFLMKNGIITKRSYPGFPPQVEYSLTATGKNMRTALAFIYQWSIENYVSPTEEIEDEYYKIFKDDSHF